MDQGPYSFLRCKNCPKCSVPVSVEVDKLNLFSLFCQFNISWRSKLRYLIFTKSHQSWDIISVDSGNFFSVKSKFTSQKTRKPWVKLRPLWPFDCHVFFLLLGYKNYTPQKISRSQGPQNLRFQGVLSSFGLLSRTPPFLGFKKNSPTFHFSENFPVFFVVLERINLFFHVGFGETSWSLENLSCSGF